MRAVGKLWVGSRAPKFESFPAGRFRSPKKGWLVVVGRRGHYHFCDTLSAYDLGTGAAYVARSCSQLKLADGGIVDVAKTDEAKTLEK